MLAGVLRDEASPFFVSVYSLDIALFVTLHVHVICVFKKK